MEALPAGTETGTGIGAPPHVRHRPEGTLLYQLVEEYYPAFRAHLAAQGKALPAYVVREFEDYLKCGRLEHGFLRVRCDSCRAEHLVAFSCKRRGFCPSCGAQRMVESAALLVDEVFPQRPVRQRRQFGAWRFRRRRRSLGTNADRACRQWGALRFRRSRRSDVNHADRAWVLSVPYPLRFLFASRPEVMGHVLGIVNRCIATHLIKKARFTCQVAQTGAVTLIQRRQWKAGGFPAKERSALGVPSRVVWQRRQAKIAVCEARSDRRIAVKRVR